MDDPPYLDIQTASVSVLTVDQCIAVSVVSPRWKGVRKASPRTEVADFLHDVVWAAQMLVVRGRAAQVLGAIGATFDKAVDWITAPDVRVLAVGKGTRKVADVFESLRKDNGAGRRRNTVRQRRVAAWINRLNGLDPVIHRGVYQLWRAIRLRDAGFVEEAITALDCLRAVAGEIAARGCAGGSVSRVRAASLLGFSKADSAALENLYQTRCAFGAHPPRTDWWDAGEIFETELPRYFELAVRLLWSAAAKEREAPVVDRDPAQWSEWFLANGTLLLDALWDQS